MNVSLSQEFEVFINEKVQSGFYNSASEVVREGLRLLKEQDELKKIRTEELKKEILRGVEDIRAGRFRTYDSADEFAKEIIKEGLEESGRKKQT